MLITTGGCCDQQLSKLPQHYSKRTRLQQAWRESGENPCDIRLLRLKLDPCNLQLVPTRGIVGTASTAGAGAQLSPELRKGGPVLPAI